MKRGAVLETVAPAIDPWGGEVLVLEGVWKRYETPCRRPGEGPPQGLAGGGDGNAWVLSDIDLRVRSGECVGLIGDNGAGKSTLLRLVAAILEPTRGRVDRRGRVVPLLDLLAGLEMDLTGRENVFWGGACRGLTRGQIRDRLPWIAAFTELGDALDQPLRHYSNGMIFRLGFALSVAAGADLLLIDEVLAVGDPPFQARCLALLRQMRRRGTAILVATHAVEALEELCNRAIWLHAGRVTAEGPPSDVRDAYHLRREQLALGRPAGPSPGTPVERLFEIRRTWFAGLSGEPHESFPAGSSLFLNLLLVPRKDLPPGSTLTLSIHREDGLCCFGTSREISSAGLSPEAHRTSHLRVHWPRSNLSPGRYYVNVSLADEDGLPRDCRVGALFFSIHGVAGSPGLYQPEARWTRVDLEHEESRKLG